MICRLATEIDDVPGYLVQIVVKQNPRVGIDSTFVRYECLPYRKLPFK
jgi:hypothetical protein